MSPDVFELQCSGPFGPLPPLGVRPVWSPADAAAAAADTKGHGVPVDPAQIVPDEFDRVKALTEEHTPSVFRLMELGLSLREACQWTVERYFHVLVSPQAKAHIVDQVLSELGISVPRRRVTAAPTPWWRPGRHRAGRFSIRVWDLIGGVR